MAFSTLLKEGSDQLFQPNAYTRYPLRVEHLAFRLVLGLLEFRCCPIVLILANNLEAVLCNLDNSSFHKNPSACS